MKVGSRIKRMSEKFNLKWNDFHSNVSKSFGLFRNESYLHDVTLVSDDFKLIPAHKLVLSASSEYFRNILQQTQQSQQPLICLDGVNSDDVRNILDYVYEGEVKISQDDLDRFLGIAQRLRIEGLVGQDEPEDIIDEEITPSQYYPKNEENYSKPVIKKQNSSKPDVFSRSLVVPTTGDDSMVKETIKENIITHPDGTLSCKVCGKVASGNRKKEIMKQHMETHIDGVSYQCPLCVKSFRSKVCLASHKYKYHKN